MARQVSVEPPGAIHHVMNRGDWHQPIYRDGAHHQASRTILGKVELGQRAKGDPEKVQVAVRLLAETALTVEWTTERLRMGTPGYVNNPLHGWRKARLRSEEMR